MMQEKHIRKKSLVPSILEREALVSWQHFSTTLTSFVGREEATHTVCELLGRAQIHLLTLTGTGGVGKTRLGLQVAAESASDFSDGIAFVPLASVHRSEQVIPLIAHTLGLRESEGHPLFEHVKAFLREKQMLLFLDNFEHLSAVAPLLGSLLLACPYLKMLVTSRTTLHIQGEYEFAVPPLALPDMQQGQSREVIIQSPAVELFVQRAQAVKSSFELTEENAVSVADICIRLDGIPLALELAAARTKILPPQVLLSRLSSRLSVLTGGGQDVSVRQKSMRDTLVWSYDLLSTAEQALFRRMAVFVHGCSLEAVEHLYTTLGESGLSVLDLVTQLVDKSLLQQHEQEEQEIRLVMLETIREFALEMLRASGEIERIQDAHAMYYTALAQQAEPELYHHLQRLWLGRLERDHDNIRAALTFLHRHGERQKLALLVGTLGWFWYMHGFLNEGRQWTERVSSAGTLDLPRSVRSKIVSGAGVFAGFLGQGEIAFVRCQESLPLCKESGDLRNLSASVYMLVHSLLAIGNAVAARELAEETLVFVRTAGDSWAVGALSCMLGSVALYEGNYTQAWQLHEEGIAIFEEEGDLCMNGLIRMMLADVAVAQGNEEEARTLIQQGREMFRQVGATWSLGNYFSFWGQIALQGGHEDRARFLLQEALQYYQHMGDQQGMMSGYALLSQIAAHEKKYDEARSFADQTIQIARSLEDRQALIACLEGLATVVAGQEKYVWAVQLWGTVERLYQSSGMHMSQSVSESRELFVQAARTALGEQVFVEAWAEGRRMTPEQVLAVLQNHILSQDECNRSCTDDAKTRRSRPAGLTPRELEILQLLTQGLSNAQIAERLVISATTVNSYLRAVYSKLGVTSRTAAMRYAIDHKLV